MLPAQIGGLRRPLPYPHFHSAIRPQPLRHKNHAKTYVFSSISGLGPLSEEPQWPVHKRQGAAVIRRRRLRSAAPCRRVRTTRSLFKIYSQLIKKNLPLGSGLCRRCPVLPGPAGSIPPPVGFSAQIGPTTPPKMAQNSPDGASCCFMASKMALRGPKMVPRTPPRWSQGPPRRPKRPPRRLKVCPWRQKFVGKTMICL